MTSPIAHGYPDYGRFQAEADKLLAALNNQNVSNPVTHGRFFVGDVPRITVTASLVTNNAKFSIEYWSASSGGVQLGGVAFTVRSGSKLDTTFPVVGPWVDITVTPSAALTVYNLDVATNHSAAHNSVDDQVGNVLVAFNQNINAGANLTVTSDRIWPGEAHWFTESAVTTWTSRVETIDHLGTAIIIDEFRATVAGDSGRTIFLPPTNVQIVVTNQSGGAGSFRGAIVARPIEPGR